MAKSLSLKVIAEGVEDEAQMSSLREHRCDEIQGYYLSKPNTASEVADKFLSAPTQAWQRYRTSLPPPVHRKSRSTVVNLGSWRMHS